MVNMNALTTDALTEAFDHEFNARFDDVHERYAGSMVDAEAEYECHLDMQREHWESLTDEQRAEINAAHEVQPAREDDGLPF